MVDIALLENGDRGNRFDPTTKVNTADASGRLILNLGDRAKTLIVDESTQFIQLLNKLVETNSADKYKNLTEEERIESGYGVHVAAGTNGSRGHEAKKISVQMEDGSVDPELRTLVEIALTGGLPGGGEDDINLRIGAFDLNGPDGPFIELFVDGKWSTDLLLIKGAIAEELLSTIDGFGLSNQAPEARDDTFSGRTFLPIEGNVLDDNGNGADIDGDGDPLTVVAGTLVTANGGTVELLADGTLTYTPADGFAGEDSFSYEVEDGNGGRDTATVALNVEGWDDVIQAPQAEVPSVGSVGDSFIVGGTQIAGDGAFRSFSDLVDNRFGDDYLTFGDNGGTTIYGETFSPIDLSFTGSIDFSFGNDTIVGGDGSEAAYGDVSNLPDVLGGPGATVRVHFGNDIINMAEGNDVGYGDQGNLALRFTTPGSITDLFFGNDQVFGDDGDDNIYGDFFLYDDSTIQGRVTLTFGNDLVSGGANDDTVYGDGDTFINNSAPSPDQELTILFGDDIALGGEGSDSVYGDILALFLPPGGTSSVVEFGNDRIIGGTGDDDLYGDVLPAGIFVTDTSIIFGEDTFVFGTADGNDTIFDFQRGLDTIEIQDAALSFALLDIREEAGNTIIDFDGAGNDHSVTVQGVTGMTEDDFIFV